MYNFSKLQEQNSFMKANFETKINSLVKKLESENKQLKNRIELLNSEITNKISIV